MNDTLPRVSVVTVTWNHASYLEGYLKSLQHSQYPISEIIIIDNNSTDNSLKILRSYPHLRFIRNHENIGYSAALNQAFNQASCPLVCVTGPDIIVEPDWLQPLVACYNTDPARTFAVASRVLTLDRTEIQFAGASLHFTGHLNVFDMWKPLKSATDNNKEPIRVGAIDSTSLLIDREKFLAIGGCDPDFFVYHEEFDYCYRARMREWLCWYHPGSVVYHGNGSRGFSVRGRGDYPRLRPYLHTRNRLLSVLKNFQARTLVGILPSLALVEPLNFIMLMRLGLHAEYVKALYWLWQHRHDILQRRAEIQSTRCVDDGILLASDPLTITPVLLQSASLRIAKAMLDRFLCLYWLLLKALLYR